jgi:hypothetical protein
LAEWTGELFPAYAPEAAIVTIGLWDNDQHPLMYAELYANERHAAIVLQRIDAAQPQPTHVHNFMQLIIVCTFA